MYKDNLRKKVLLERNSMVEEEKNKKDILILEKLKNELVYKKSKRIFIYVGFKSEINTLKYIESFLQDGKEIFVPKTDMENKEMKAIKLTSVDELKLSNYGILEPMFEENVADGNSFDLIIVPGAVFDLDGNRIGYGGGYYDKYLDNIKGSISKVALAYSFQVLNNIPNEEHDIKVNYIITENEVITIKNGKTC